MFKVVSGSSPVRKIKFCLLKTTDGGKSYEINQCQSKCVEGLIGPLSRLAPPW